MQQVIAEPGILEKWFTNQNTIKKLRASFTGLYPLDQSQRGKEAYQNALQYPTRYVMKPQREC